MLKRNTANKIFFVMVNTSDGSPVTSGTVNGYYSHGSSLSGLDSAPTHIGNGLWKSELSAAEMNNAQVGLLFTHSSGVPVAFTLYTDTKITSDLNDASSTTIYNMSRQAVEDYDPPTHDELLTVENNIRGADSDSLKTISDQIDAIGGGAGAVTKIYTITDSSTGLPLADVDVWVTTDVSGNNVIASGKTNQNGQVTFNLDAGTVYIWRQKSGYDFVNPDTEVVSQ